MNSERGFTLVELLFAMVAGSLLLIMLGWAIRGLEAQVQRSGRIGAAEQVARLTDFMGATVALALPPATGAAFVGDEDRLTLTVPPPRVLGAIGPVRLTLAVEGSASKALVATFAPASRAQTLPSAAANPVTLADGFKDIRFTYLRRATDPATSLPRLITVQFVDRGGNALPLGIKPRLTMAADCQFDPISLTCRH